LCLSGIERSDGDDEDPGTDMTDLNISLNKSALEELDIEMLGMTHHLYNKKEPYFLRNSHALKVKFIYTLYQIILQVSKALTNSLVLVP
jgi:hypothetical protein